MPAKRTKKVIFFDDVEMFTRERGALSLSNGIDFIIYASMLNLIWNSQNCAQHSNPNAHQLTDKSNDLIKLFFLSLYINKFVVQ